MSAGPGTRPRGAALVTGGSRGIGAATARRLAGQGWPVAVNYSRDEEGARQVAAEIKAAGGRALTVCANVADPQAIDPLFERIEAELGPVLVLVNNAGIRADNLAAALLDEEWDAVLDTNLSGAFRVARRALMPMVRARYGRIVNVASVVGERANAGQTNYAAAKAGLVALTRTMAVEVARRGVTVNAVAPGLIRTSLTGDVPEDAEQAIPIRRAGTPDEVAACIAFLTSDDAAYVTATTITVDGGLSA